MAEDGKKVLPAVPPTGAGEDVFGDKIVQYGNESIHRVKLALTDIDGVLRGKYVSMEKFVSMVRSTGGFCDCVLGWDMEDQLYDNARFTGWHTAYPDALFRLDAATERRLKEEKNTPFFLGDFVNPDGNGLHPICPRSTLKRILAWAADMGFGARLGFEYEFFVFDETPHSVREKNYRDLKPLTPGNFGYSVLRSSVQSDLFHSFMEYCSGLDCPLEALHCETGPGVWEAALANDVALGAADKAILFKTFTKVFFQKREKMATFMAKWSAQYPGQSGHLHQSLFNLKTGKPLFHLEGGRVGMSETMEHYVAGLQKYLRPFLVMSAPTINSYSRLVKGAWAPTSATWGVENRTTALRVIPGGEKSQRVEFRIGAADGNPYLVAAACIAAGLLGVEQKLKLGEPVQGNAYAIQDRLGEEFQLPGNLRDSLRNFAACPEAKEVFGAPFVEHFLSTREWEVREYERAITDWQLKRYFEII